MDSFTDSGYEGLEGGGAAQPQNFFADPAGAPPGPGSAGAGTGGVPESLEGLSPFAQSMAKAYGGKFLASGHSFVQSRMGFFSGAMLHYYFNVSPHYVANKLKVLLCPFLHKGSWTRIPEQVAGGLTYKPPRHDINAPDLYIPLMAFFTYTLAYCSVEVAADRFSPEDMSNGVWWGAMAWGAQVLLLRVLLYMLSTSQVAINVPWMDLVAYGGYPFVFVSLELMAGLVSRYAYYGMLVWGSLCMAVFLVKTMKRILFAEARHYTADTRHNYLLLAMAVAQLPISWWLGILP